MRTKQRVHDHGEVFTPAHIVNSMLGLVEKEAERIESRFLEPACGNGNFLVEVLERKLRVAEKQHHKHLKKYERCALLSVASIYGIDVLHDNVQECRGRLFNALESHHLRLFKSGMNKKYEKVIRTVLQRNVVWGDFLAMLTCGNNPSPIVFADWLPTKDNPLQHKDFSLNNLVVPNTAS